MHELTPNVTVNILLGKTFLGFLQWNKTCDNLFVRLNDFSSGVLDTIYCNNSFIFINRRDSQCHKFYSASDMVAMFSQCAYQILCEKCNCDTSCVQDN